MLTKLLKYEFRATARVYGGMYLALLAVAGLIGFSVRSDQSSAMFNDQFFQIMVGLYTVLALALVVITVVTVIQRFSQNLLGREGYLMHTLPVTEAQLVASKLLSSAVWLLCSAAVGVLSIFIMMALSVRTLQLDMTRFFDDWATLKSNLPGEFWSSMVWTGVLCDVRVLCTILCVYAACMVGHLFRAHNGIASVAAFFLMSWVQNRLESLLAVGGFLRILEGPSGTPVAENVLTSMSYTTFFAGSLAVTAAFGAVYFGLTVWLMKNKLNLA